MEFRAKNKSIDDYFGNMNGSKRAAKQISIR